MAIWEFLCFLMIATSCAANWSNKIVFYATDNQLVWRWLTNMRARSRVANFICGLITFLMARFRFECFSAYINTKKNMLGVPSRTFDADDVREGPGLDGIGEYMASTFPGMVQISVSEQLKHYLRPGGLLAAYELYVSGTRWHIRWHWLGVLLLLVLCVSSLVLACTPGFSRSSGK